MEDKEGERVDLTDAVTKKIVRWYWAGDTHAQQDTWMRYAEDVEAVLEKGFLLWEGGGKVQTLSEVAVDKHRFVDLPNMLQRRYAARHLRRLVLRALLDPVNPQDPVMGGAKRKAAAFSTPAKAVPPGKKQARVAPVNKGKAKVSSSSEQTEEVGSDDEATEEGSIDTDGESEEEGEGSVVNIGDEDLSKYIVPHMNKRIIWYWAGDSPGGGHQDLWIKYSPKMSRRIEKALNATKKRCKVDDERFVDLQNMLQRRHDDEMKRRMVKREETVIKKSKRGVADAAVRATKATLGAAAKGRAAKALTAPSAAAGGAKSRGGVGGRPRGTWNVAGKVIVLTGKMNSRRAEMEKKLLTAGATMGRSVTRSTDVVVTGVRPGQALQQAKALGIEVWTEADLTQALKASPPPTSAVLVTTKNKSKRGKGTGGGTSSSDYEPSDSGEDTEAEEEDSSDEELSESDEEDDSLNTPAAATLDLATTGQSLFGFPSYWKGMAALATEEVDIEATSPEFALQRDLFLNTLHSSHKNAGHVHKVKFKNFEVTRLVRVQNPTLWLRYYTRKKKILSDLAGACPPTGNVLMKCVDPAVNEYYFYHGLNSSFIPGITRFGFDPRFCSLEGMFGAGLYFAENSSKSNQYVHTGSCTLRGPSNVSQCKCLKRSECCMLVCRVLLGDALVEKNYRGNFKKGDYWYGRRTEPTKPDGSMYHSVIGESRPNYRGAALQLREYIVYESSQVYPEYLLYYKRK